MTFPGYPADDDPSFHQPGYPAVEHHMPGYPASPQQPGYSPPGVTPHAQPAPLGNPAHPPRPEAYPPPGHGHSAGHPPPPAGPHPKRSPSKFPIIAAAVVVVIVVCGLLCGLAGYSPPVPMPRKGDCLAGSDLDDDIDVVDCSAPDAGYEVVAGTTSEMGVIGICEGHDDGISYEHAVRESDGEWEFRWVICVVQL